MTMRSDPDLYDRATYRLPKATAVQISPRPWRHVYWRYTGWRRRILDAWGVLTGKWNTQVAYQAGLDEGAQAEYARLILNGAWMAEIISNSKTPPPFNVEAVVAKLEAYKSNANARSSD